MSASHSDTFEQLQQRIRQVVELYQQEKTENEQLKKKRIELEERLKLDNNRLDDLEEKYNKLKISKALIASSDDVHDAKLKVNRMVREIDKCIALLNR
jgi:cytochrome c-type biogenesis protein CcmH/NrfG